MRLIALGLLALTAAAAGLLWGGWLLEGLRKLSRRRWLAYLAPLLLLALPTLLVEARLGAPLPRIHDEFSYLLAADTFASGRLTNPPHPLWEHFETFHVNHVPTYNSMYQPGQGLFLAAGKVLFGHSWFGVLIGSVAFSWAAVWALRQFFPPFWALIAALISVAGVTCNYWTFSYWGGCAAAFGGALVIGAIGSFRRKPSVMGGLALGAGSTVLLLTRPYEGAFLGLAAIISIALVLRERREMPWDIGSRSFFAAAMVVFIAGLTFNVIYCYANTGSYWTLPYQVNLRRYMRRPMFAWENLKSIRYNHALMEQAYQWFFRSHYTDAERFIAKLDPLQFFFRPFWLFVPFAIGLLSWKRRTKYLNICLLLVCFALLFSYWVNPHYAAPAAIAFAALIILGLRKLYAIRSWPLRLRGALVVGAMASAIFVPCTDMFALMLKHKPLDVSLRLFPRSIILPAGYSFEPYDWATHRLRITNDLVQSNRNHLILVRYQPTHDMLNEWVYNTADIDHAPVVWAREWKVTADKQLIEYFAGRTVWLLDADRYPYQLQPYPMERFKDSPVR